jgi:hypothetical protein
MTSPGEKPTSCVFAHIFRYVNIHLKKEKNNEVYIDITFAIMSNEKTSPTSIEHFPVEIYLQIFAFFPLPEIISTFSGLNSYIDSIIRSVIGASHIVKYNDIDAINLLQLFSTQISRLIIAKSETVDFKSLINLRSLTLNDGTEAQLSTIRPRYFPMLEILHIKGNEL